MSSFQTSLEEAVFLALTENADDSIKSDGTILYFPGGFKPPHKGHLALVNAALEKFPNAQLVIMSGEAPRGGITSDKAKAVWEIYLGTVGKDKNIVIRTLQPEFPINADGSRVRKYVRGAGVKKPMSFQEWKEKNLKGAGLSDSDMEDVYRRAAGIPKSGKKSFVRDDEGEPITVEFSTASPIVSLSNAIRFKDKPKRAIIIASSEDPKNAESIAQSLQNLQLPVESLVIPVSVRGLEGEVKMSASGMRQALKQGFKEFSQFLPEELSAEQMQKIFSLLGGELNEFSGAAAAGGYSVPLSRQDDEEERLVSEVANYLLNILVD